MSEHKYYVKLDKAFQPDGKYLVQLGFNGSDYYFDRYNGSAAENYNQNSFTKSELDEIMGGALYKGHEPNMDCVNLGCQEWINPLIELVPVEDEE